MPSIRDLNGKPVEEEVTSRIGPGSAAIPVDDAVNVAEVRKRAKAIRERRAGHEEDEADEDDGIPVRVPSRKPKKAVETPLLDAEVPEDVSSALLAVVEASERLTAAVEALRVRVEQDQEVLSALRKLMGGMGR